MLTFIDRRERAIFERLRDWWLSSGPDPDLQDVATTSTIVLRSSITHVDVDTTAGSVTITLPPLAQMEGKQVVFTKVVAANTMTIEGDGAEAINGAANIAKTVQWDRVWLIARDDTWRSI